MNIYMCTSTSIKCTLHHLHVQGRVYVCVDNFSIIIEYLLLQEERQVMLNSIPPEPDTSCKDKVSSIRMRFPDGSVDQRRFLADTHTLRMILNYVGSKGYPSIDYKVLTSFPKRNVCYFHHSRRIVSLCIGLNFVYCPFFSFSHFLQRLSTLHDTRVQNTVCIDCMSFLHYYYECIQWLFVHVYTTGI